MGRRSGSVVVRPVGPVSVGIEDVTAEAVFASLPAAVEALWAALRQLPLGWEQYRAYEEFFGPGAIERVEDFLVRDGRLELAFTMAGRTHGVWVCPVGRGAA